MWILAGLMAASALSPCGAAGPRPGRHREGWRVRRAGRQAALHSARDTTAGKSSCTWRMRHGMAASSRPPPTPRTTVTGRSSRATTAAKM